MANLFYNDKKRGDITANRRNVPLKLSDQKAFNLFSTATFTMKNIPCSIHPLPIREGSNINLFELRKMPVRFWEKPKIRNVGAVFLLC